MQGLPRAPEEGRRDGRAAVPSHLPPQEKEVLLVTPAGQASLPTESGTHTQ